MKRIVLLALALGALSLPGPRPAEARHCGHNQIRRVSMGICVSTRSRLAYGYVRARRSIRYGWRNRHSFHRYREARLQQEEEGQANERERRSKIKPPPVLLRHHTPRLAPQDLEVQAPPPPVEDTEVPYVIEMPFGIQGSRLMLPPRKSFDWIKP